MYQFSTGRLSFQEKVSWIRLSRTYNIGNITFFNLLKHFGSIDNALNNVKEYSLKGGLKKPIELYSIKRAKIEIENSQKAGAQIIAFIEPDYPKLLKEIADPPPILTVKGDVSLLNQDIIAIVGPRNASINGCKFAKIIAKELGNYDIVIASGMARGIDTVVHQSSLETGTIAIVAGGVDYIYPPENKKLYHQIVESGAIVSENQYGTPPKGGNFPRRNRIISGLSLGVAVIEATLRSGTLITARFAAEQNREIFAVPGSPFDPRSQGANRLIKQGAHMIEGSNDILEEIKRIRKQRDSQLEFRDKDPIDFIGFEPKHPDDSEINEARKLILEKINYTPLIADEIIAELQIPTQTANVVFMQLELANKIENKNGKISRKF